MSVRSMPDSPLVTSLAKRQKTSHGGNSFFTEPTIKVQVKGGRLGQRASRARKTWYLHRAPLMDESPIFHKRFCGTAEYFDRDNVLFLENTSADTVDAFSHWLYTKSLQIPELRLDFPYPEEINGLPNFETAEDDNSDIYASNDDGARESKEDEDEDEDHIYSSSDKGAGILSHVGHGPKDSGSDSDVTLGRSSPAPSRQSKGSMVSMMKRGSRQRGSPAPAKGSFASIMSRGVKPVKRATRLSQKKKDAAASAAADAVSSLRHPFDRVTARLLDLYIFAQTYELPALRADVFDLWQRFCDYHRADRPHHSLEVLRRACDHLLHFRPSSHRDPLHHHNHNDDPLWAWLTTDFVKGLDCHDEERLMVDDDKAVPALAVIDEMWHDDRQTLPPAFWRAVFKGKVAADAGLLSGYHARLLAHAQASAAKIARLEAAAQAEAEAKDDSEWVETRQVQVAVAASNKEAGGSAAQPEMAAVVHLGPEPSPADETIARLEAQAKADRATIEVLQAQAQDDDNKIRGLEVKVHDNADEIEYLIRRIQDGAQEHQAETKQNADRVAKYRETIQRLHDEHAAELQRATDQVAEHERTIEGLEVQMIQVVEAECARLQSRAAARFEWRYASEHGEERNPYEHPYEEAEDEDDDEEETDECYDY
ncbi:hypothetical protein PG990_011642 [Apiospora arundinis]